MLRLNQRFPAYLLVAVLICVLFAGPGCMTLGTYNSPQTMPDGSTSVGVGTGVFVERGEAGQRTTVTPLPSAYGRIGLGSRVDAGLKAAPYVLFADVKYQLLDRRVDVAADLGVSYGVPNTVGAYPALYVGTDRFYAGGRLAVLSGHVGSEGSSVLGEDAAFSGVVPGAVVGASFGDRFRVRPEVNVHFSTGDGSPMVLPGIGFQYRLGDGQ